MDIPDSVPLALAISGVLFAAGGLGMSVVLRDASTQAPQGRHARIGATVLGVALIATSVVLYLLPAALQSPATSATTATSPSPSTSPAAALRFVPLPEGLHPRCNQYLGTGRIPDGSVLAVYERSVNPDGTSNGQGFSLVGIAKNVDTGWQTPRMEHGADFVQVAAVLLDKKLYEFLIAQYVVREDGKRVEGITIQMDALPPGVEVPSLVLHIDLEAPSCAG